MASIPANVHVKLSTEAAENFTDAYYLALQNSRKNLGTFYTRKSTLADGKTVPTVIWNGHLFEDIAIFQAMLDETMAYLHYDVQSLDCQSIMPQVSGTVRLERARTGPLRGFSETFVLVPNAHDQASGRAAAGKRQWLVQTQNFRFVV